MVNRTKELQDRLNGPEAIIDLKGENWPISRLIVHVGNSGKTLFNGTISDWGSDGRVRYGLIELVQNRKYVDFSNIAKTKVYAAGKVNITFDTVIIDGGFDFDCGLQEHNELVAAERGKDFNLVTNISYQAGDVTFINTHFKNSGNSGWAGTCENLVVSNCKADKVAKHGLGCRAASGGMNVFVDGFVTNNCGNTLDLSIVDKEFFDIYNPDTATIKNVNSKNNRGRTKQASRNWVASLYNLHFEQDNVINMNLWPAFDLTFRSHHIEVDGFTAINFPTSGFGTLADTRVDGTVELRNANIINSLSGIKCQQRMLASNVKMTGCYQKYVSGTPAEQNVQFLTPGTAQTWADVFKGIEKLYQDFNIQYGTAYDPSYWIPNVIKNLMIASA